MNYTSETFKNCTFNPCEEYPFKAYPRLKEIVVDDDHKASDEEDGETESHVPIPADKLTRYIIALYDPKSPLIKGESNLLRRKEVAAGIAGFNLKKDEEMLEIIYECQYEHIALMIQNFLRMFVKSMEWALLSSYEATFWEYQSRLMQPVGKGSKDKDSMSAVSSKTQIAKDAREMLDMYKSEFANYYADEKPLIEAVGRIRGFTPEKMAKAK